MPGKYPLITAPTREKTSLAAGGTPGLSESDTNTLRKMFPNSPIYKSMSGGAQSDAQYRTYAAGYLQPTIQQGDVDQFPDGVNLDFKGTPEFPTDPAEYEGRYLPYLVVPSDPSARTDGTSSGVERAPNDNFGSGSPVTEVLPEQMSALIAATTIDTEGPIAPKGQSGTGGANSSTTTHALNSGAYSGPS